MDTKIQSLKKEKERSRLSTLKTAGKVLLCGTLGALLGRAALPFGAMPLGLALVCSCSAYAPAALAGALLSLIGVRGAIPLASTYVIAVVLRLIFSAAHRTGKIKKARARSFFYWGFYEPVYLRSIAAAVAAFALGAYRLAIGGFLYYDLIGMLINMSVASLGAVVLYPLSDDSVAKKQRTRLLFKDVAYVALCAATVFSLKGYAPYGVSLSVLICMLITLYSTKRRGIPFGVVASIASGLCVSVEYAPLFVFASVCYGLLSAVSPTLGCFSAFLAGMSWGVYLNGISALLFLLSPLMSATVVFLVIERLFLTKNQSNANDGEAVKKAEERQSVTALDSSDIAVARLDDSTRRIKELCTSLSALSDSLLADTQRQTNTVIAGSQNTLLCAEIGDEGVVVRKDNLRSNGRVREGKERLLDDRDIADMSTCAELSENGESFALDIATISDYIADIMAGNDIDYQPNDQLAEEICEHLREKLPSLSLRIGVFGGHRRKIIVCCDDIDKLRVAHLKIEKEICRHFDLSLEAREPFEMGGRAYVVLERRAVLDVSFAHRRRNALGQTVCGDSAGTVTDGDGGRAYAYISDGMGSGERAARTSELCATFLSKLLPINDGSGKSICGTLGMINGFVRRQNAGSSDECCATVDLGVFDLIEGKVSFYKSGAAPTFVFRDGSLFKLRTRTVPIGIIKEPDFGRVDMELLPGDVLVMVSDGLTDGREECPELFELLQSRLITHNADQLADSIIAYADKIGCTDDVSVIVARIDECIFSGKRPSTA